MAVCIVILNSLTHSSNLDETPGMIADGSLFPPKDYMGVVLPPRARRPGSDGDGSARDHALYKKPVTGPDGLFHCPWEGQPTCGHKPEKLKCNYE